jgi:hypothetical protein
MTAARKTLIHVDTTPYYHCISRCVRRAFLCGKDQFSGRSYEHRKQWIVDLMKQLSGVFAIDVCAYAITSNHHYLVLRVNKNEATQWSTEEVIDRWCNLFKGHSLVIRYRAGESLSRAERNGVSEIIEEWRDRLMNISWFMVAHSHLDNMLLHRLERLLLVFYLPPSLAVAVLSRHLYIPIHRSLRTYFSHRG